jgi:hypothetical protein
MDFLVFGTEGRLVEALTAFFQESSGRGATLAMIENDPIIGKIRRPTTYLFNY